MFHTTPSHLQSVSTPHSLTPTSSILAGPRLPRPLPYGMKPVQLTWQKEVTYDEHGNILGVVKLDPTKFPSHRYNYKMYIRLLHCQGPSNTVSSGTRS